MYYFIFERPLTRPLLETSHQIEDEVVAGGIAGELVELTPGRNLDGIIADAHRKGYQTIAVVGGSKLVNQVASRLLRYEMVMGIIPLVNSAATARLTGVSGWQEAVQALRQRRWQYAAMGRVGDTAAILTPAQLLVHPSIPLNLTTPRYEAVIKASHCEIVAVFRGQARPYIEITARSVVSAPQPRWWRLFSGGHTEASSVFREESVGLSSRYPLPLVVDGQTIARTPIIINVMPKAIKLIVSRSGPVTTAHSTSLKDVAKGGIN